MTAYACMPSTQSWFSHVAGPCKSNKHSNSSSDSTGTNNIEKMAAGPSKFAPDGKAGKPGEPSSGHPSRRVSSNRQNDLQKQAAGLSTLGLHRKAGQVMMLSGARTSKLQRPHLAPDTLQTN